MELSIMSWGHVDPRLGGQREWQRGRKQRVLIVMFGWGVSSKICMAEFFPALRLCYEKSASFAKAVLWVVGFPKAFPNSPFAFRTLRCFKFPKSDLSVSIKNVAWIFFAGEKNWRSRVWFDVEMFFFTVFQGSYGFKQMGMIFSANFTFTALRDLDSVEVPGWFPW